MNNATYEILKNELENKQYRLFGQYSIDKLLDIYSEMEINSYDDLYVSHSDIRDFIKENLHLFYDTDHPESKASEDDAKSLSLATYHFVTLFSIFNNKHFKRYRDEQENWIRLIKNIIGYTPTKILEVGSGTMPYSSIRLSQDLGKITSIDKFRFTDNILKRLNVEPINKFFDSQSDVSYYDFVIGKKPCTAIKEIVETCTAKKLPYLIELCDCYAPAGTISSWQGLLKHIDSKIKFSKDDKFAYNLDTPLAFNEEQEELSAI